MKEEKQDWKFKMQDEVVLDQAEAAKLATRACLAAGAIGSHRPLSRKRHFVRRALWTFHARIPPLGGLP